MLPEPTTEPARRHVWVVLPAFNEEAALPHLLERLAATFAAMGEDYRIVLVDDGSSDDTTAIAERASHTLPLTLERHAVNQGLGATLRDGLLKACELAAEGDAIVTLDADNSQPPELIPRLVQRLREGRGVVIASRYRPGSAVRGVPLSRRALSFWGSALFQLVFPIPGVRDYTCGFRAYRAELLQQAIEVYGSRLFDQAGFQCMVDLLLKLRRLDPVCGEVPLVLRYDHKPTASKMRVAHTVVQTLRLMARRRIEGRRTP